MGSRWWTPASSGFSPTHQRYWSYLDLLVENDWLLSQQGGTFLCQSATNHTSLRIAWESGAFLEHACNVIAVGKPGVGKSHALAAVGHELLVQGHAVLWCSTASLVQRLLAAKRDLRLPQELARLDKFACVILDDIGYVQQDRDEMEVLFTFLAERYEHKSVMITTNLVFSEWQRIFKNPMTTLAAIDRVVHHSVILDMMSVESYRAEVAGQHHLSEEIDSALLNQSN
jgi:IstB-like ATP binding protein